jgi:hypothetical protein
MNWPAFLTGLALLCSGLAPLNAADSVVSFGQPGALTQWTGLKPADVTEGVLRLEVGNRGQYAGRATVFRPRLNFWNPQGLTLELDIAGFDQVPPVSPTYAQELRLFLAPQVPGFAEPYSFAPNMAIYVAYHQGQVTLHFYTKETGAAFGTMKWVASGKFTPTRDNPLRLRLTLDQTNYRFQVTPALESNAGGLSGPHGLTEAIWKDGCQFGMRAVNVADQQDGVVEISGFSAGGNQTALASAPTAPLVPAAPSFSGPVTVTVDPGYEYAVNGVSTVQEILGVVVNGESRMRHVAETAALRLPTTRLYLWVNWDPPRTRPVDRPADWASQDFDKLVPLYFDRALGIDPATGKRARTPWAEFWQLEQLVAWGATREVTLHIDQAQPKTEADFAGYSRLYRAVVRECRARFPGVQVKYVMLFNEPDFEYPRKWETGGIEPSVAFYCRFYEQMNVEMHKEFPDVEIIGPGISGFMNADRWRFWTLPFVAQATSARWFNCQPYESDFYQLAAWAEMLQAECLRQRGRRLPLMMTESNVNLEKPATNWWEDQYHVDRVRQEAEHLFGMFSQPDTYHARYYFYYHYTCTWEDMWWAPDGKWSSDEESKIVPAPTYWLHYVLRNFTGTRLFAASDREGSGVRVLAATGDPAGLVVALFNDSDQAREVNLQVLWPAGWQGTSASRDYLYYDAATQAFRHGTEACAFLPARLTLRPGEITCFTAAVGAHPGSAANKLQETTYFAQGTYRSVTAEPRYVLPAPPAPEHATVWVRFAVYLDDLLGVDRVEWQFNGHAGRQGLAGPRPPGTNPHYAWVEYAVPPQWLQAQNTLVFTPPAGSDYRVMFVALVYKPWPPGTALPPPPTPEVAAGLNLSLELPALVSGSDTVEGKVRLTNLTNSAAPQTVTLTAPEGWTLVEPAGGTALLSGAPGTTEAAVQLRRGADLRRGEYFLEAAAGGLRARRGLRYYPDVQAARRAPGSSDDLQAPGGAPALAMNFGPPLADPPLSTVTRLSWDDRYLYATVEVKGRKIETAPTDQYWRGTGLEFFFDWDESRRATRSEQTTQVWVSVRDATSGGPVAGLATNDPNGVFLPPQPLPGAQVHAAETSEGLAIQVALPWAGIIATKWVTKPFVPTVGATLGFELALNPLGNSVVGGVGKAWAKPNEWGILRLTP